MSQSSPSTAIMNVVSSWYFRILREKRDNETRTRGSLENGVQVRCDSSDKCSVPILNRYQCIIRFRRAWERIATKTLSGRMRALGPISLKTHVRTRRDIHSWVIYNVLAQKRRKTKRSREKQVGTNQRWAVSQQKPSPPYPFESKSYRLTISFSASSHVSWDIVRNEELRTWALSSFVCQYCTCTDRTLACRNPWCQNPTENFRCSNVATAEKCWKTKISLFDHLQTPIYGIRKNIIQIISLLATSRNANCEQTWQCCAAHRRLDRRCRWQSPLQARGEKRAQKKVRWFDIQGQNERDKINWKKKRDRKSKSFHFLLPAILFVFIGRTVCESIQFYHFPSLSCFAVV